MDMSYLEKSENYYSNNLAEKHRVGIRSFKDISSKRKRRLYNEQIDVFGMEYRGNYDIPYYRVHISSLKYQFYC